MAAPRTPRPKARSDLHTRVVRVLRWVLPGLALILLASIFLISNKARIASQLIALPPEIAEVAEGQKITNPHFAGVTRGGDAFSLYAEWALPDAPSPRRIELAAPRATLDFKGGRSVETSAREGLLDLRTSEAVLAGEVSIRTSNGYLARSPRLVMSFETGNVTAEGPVRAEGPVGRIEAGGMALVQNLDRQPEGNAVLVFSGGVKLVYTPTGSN